jgi:transposase InsO family protein
LRRLEARATTAGLTVSKQSSAGSRPRYVITDKGEEFFCWLFKTWCRERGIRPRFGAVGQHGSICIVERFIRSMKTECTRRIIVPFRRSEMRRQLSSYATWYNRHRPHSGLDGRTPAEAYHGTAAARDALRYEPRPRWKQDPENRRGRPGVRLELVLRHHDGRRHLPVVELRGAA